jgi:hypothetical protein
MGLRLNTDLLKQYAPIMAAIGLIGAVAYGFYKFHNFMGERSKQGEIQQASRIEANKIVGNLKSKDQDLTVYSILGPNTLSVEEGNIIYRFNFAAGMMVIRNTFEDVQRTDQVSIMTFNEFGNPDYIQKLKDVGCQISASAPAELKKYDISTYSQQNQNDIKNNFALVKKFGEFYCGLKG